MKQIILSILFLIVVSLNTFSQDTIVGWTFPVGQNLPLSDYGNENNKGYMYFEAVNNYEIPFGSISLLRQGNTTMSASISGWDTAVLKRAWKFSVDATNIKNMKIYARISSDCSNPGPRDFKIQVMNGCCDPVWKDIDNNIVKAEVGWNIGFINGVSIPSTSDNMPGLKVRFLLTSDTATDGNLLTHNGISLVDDIFVTGEKIVGIELQANSPVVLYYQPLSRSLYFSVDNQSIEICIYDLNGKLISGKSMVTGTGQIDVMNFNPGLYMVTLRSKQHSETRKILIY